MTILNINKYHFIKGGAERFYFELAKLLEEKGHKVIPFSMLHTKNKKTEYEKCFVSEIQTEEVKFGWQGLRTVTRYFWSFEARRKLKKLIKTEKPELAILHNIYHQISPSILPVLKEHKIPTILIAHDYGLLSPNYNMFANGKIYDKICGCGFLKCLLGKCVKNSFWASLVCSLEMWFHHTVLNIYQKNIDIIICPSEFVRQMFLRAGWPAEKLIHLPYFIKQPTTNNQQLTKRQQNYILYLGRLSEEKGVDILIEAMKNLPEVKLKIVGTGIEKESYKLQITSYKLQNVELLGYKNGEELIQIIANAKFIVVPSIWYENYPMSVLESYIWGVPALVSNIGGLPEMIPDQDKNFMFEAGNTKELSEKIKFLWHNQNFLDGAGERVRSFVRENNDAENYYKKLIELCKSLS